MRITTLVKKANESGRHKVLSQSKESIILKRNFEPKWIIILNNGKFDHAHKEMHNSTKVTSVQVLANYLNLE
jgi:hypothetical protein